jgi:hypothetical protein
MKTQVVHLDPHDDVTSVHDKISWAKTERILLVFPRRSRILSRVLDLRLLQRYAATQGAQLAIVTRGNELRLVAKELGIPIFSKLSIARRSKWQPGLIPQQNFHPSVHPDLRQIRRDTFPLETSWQDRFSYRFILFTLAVLAILAVLIIFIPSASIQLTPATRIQNLKFTVSASLDVTAINLAGSIPARLTSVIVERTKTVPVTGSVAIPDARSVGLVRFRNLTTSKVSIPAGTVVSTQSNSPVRFTTTNTAEVVAGVGKTVDVPVQAIEAGSNANLPADTLVAMESDLGASLAVTNPTSTGGGSDRTAAIQTAGDRRALHTALLADILDQCKANLQQTLISGFIYFPDALVISQVLTEAYFPAEGQAGDTLSLTLRLQCQAQYSSSADVNMLVEKLLNTTIPEGFIPESGTQDIQSVTAPVTDSDGITRWNIQAQRRLRARIDSLAAIQLSLGHTSAEVVRRLRNYLPLAESPVIHMKPGWWPWLPLIPFRITVTNN